MKMRQTIPLLSINSGLDAAGAGGPGLFDAEATLHSPSLSFTYTYTHTHTHTYTFPYEPGVYKWIGQVISGTLSAF